MTKHKSSPRLRFAGAALILMALILLLPAVRTGDQALFLLAVVLPCAALLCETLLARMFSLDRMILSVSLWLCAAGIAALAPSDSAAAMAQSLRCGAGLAALLIGGVMIRSMSSSLLPSVCSAFLGLLLLAGRLPASSFTVPLTEAALALLLIAFAALLTRQGPISAGLAAAAALALLLVCGETAEALFWSVTVCLLFFAADGRLVVVLPALAVAALSLFAAFRFSPLPGIPEGNAGLSALVSAGAIGADPLPEAIPALGGDSLFPRLAGHYGLVFAGLTVLLMLPLILRGAYVAVSARTRFHAVLAMGISLMLALRTLASMLSAFGFLPVAVPPPLLTLSLPSLCAQLFLIGMLCGISGRNDADLAEDAHLAMLAK